MKIFSCSCMLFIVAVIATGCTSTSFTDSLAQISQEQNQNQSQQKTKVVNKKVLMNIQALRLSHKAAKHSYTFIYDLNNKELSYSDKITITQLLEQQKQQYAVINIAPAKGDNNLAQLSLSIERAKALRQFISRLNKQITINFSPELSTDTINLVIGV